MKLPMATLTIVTAFIANSALAFEANLTDFETRKMLGEPMVQDLAVGVKGMVTRVNFCPLDGQLFLEGGSSLETDPSPYGQHFNIVLQPDGAFQADLVTDASKSKRIVLVLPWRDACTDEAVELGLFPISSISGFTDMRSFVEYLIEQGYK